MYSEFWFLILYLCSLKVFRMLSISRPIRPDDFDLIAQIPEISGVARDEDTRMFWCTKLFIQWAREMRPVERMVGSTLHDALPLVAARERAEVQRRVIETGRCSHHYQLSRDRRMLVSVFPLDEKAFGHRGVLGLVKDAPFRLDTPASKAIPVLSTPNLYRLSSLSMREFEILHYVATGISTREIAALVCRANKTIEHHVNSIHSKLGTHSRAQLVRFASERGIQAFTAEEWASIVRGVRSVKNSEPAAGEIELKDLGSGAFLDSDHSGIWS